MTQAATPPTHTLLIAARAADVGQRMAFHAAAEPPPELAAGEMT